MTSEHLNVTSLEHLNALRARGEISETDYETLRDALDRSAPKREVAPEPTKRLTKSWKNRELGGVCAGIAERMGTSANLVRLLFVIGAFVSSGAFLLLYVLLALALPWDDEPNARTFLAVVSYAAKLLVCVLALNLTFYIGMTVTFRSLGAHSSLVDLARAFDHYNSGYNAFLYPQVLIVFGLLSTYWVASQSARNSIERGTFWGFLLVVVGIVVMVVF